MENKGTPPPDQDVFTRRDVEVAYWMGVMNGAGHKESGRTPWPSMDRLLAELERVKKYALDIPSHVRALSRASTWPGETPA